MGRVKKHKLKKSLDMKKAVSKRWTSKSTAAKDIPISEIVENYNLCSGPSTSGDKQSMPEASVKYDRPKGYALIAGYRPTVNLDDEAAVYSFIDLNILKDFLVDMPCKFCLDKNTNITYSYTSSFVVSVEIECNSCSEKSSFQTSRSITDTNTNRNFADINRRMVRTFQSLGKGHMGMETFCMGLNMPCMSHSTYDKQVLKVATQTNLHARESLKKARKEVEKAYLEVDSTLEEGSYPIDISVSYDGSWHKRGFTSKYGVGCIIELITGLVVDYEVLSKYCRVCENKKRKFNEESEEFQAWFVTHQPSCQANYDGSSPAMETEAAERMWRRSEELGFRYTSVVSDGDSKTHEHIQSLHIYGEEVSIEKQECVNHVAKRLGTGLRKLKKVCSIKKITLGGKKPGSLKDTTIEKLTRYYRNAIVSNLGDVEAMKKSIFATLDHCRSTDNKPQHNKCPSGKESWCFYQRDLANGIIPRKHVKYLRTPLNETVVKHILPIYQRLTNENLLKRCSAGLTQNANEALHGLIWSKCPKTTFLAKRKVEAAVGESISVYNEGYLLTVTQLLTQVGLSPGASTARLAKLRDIHRLRLRKARSTEKFKKYKRLLKSSQLKEEERKISKEGKTYGGGEF